MVFQFNCIILVEAIHLTEFKYYISLLLYLLPVVIRAILITKMKTRIKMIVIRLLKLKLELRYSKKLKLYKTILIHGSTN